MQPAILLALVLSLVLPFTPALAAPASFSADITHTAGGQKVLSGKAWVAPGKMRVESTVQGVSQVLITDTAARKVVMLQPQMKMYMETKMDPANASMDALAEGNPGEGEWKVLGRETIDGWDCEKRAFLFKDPSKGEMTAWFSDKLGLPIRSVSKNAQGTAVMEFTNIKVQNVEASRFAVPSGYRKMEIPPAVQGMIPGMKPGQ